MAPRALWPPKADVANGGVVFKEGEKEDVVRLIRPPVQVDAAVLVDGVRQLSHPLRAEEVQVSHGGKSDVVHVCAVLPPEDLVLARGQVVLIAITLEPLPKPVRTTRVMYALPFLPHKLAASESHHAERVLLHSLHEREISIQAEIVAVLREGGVLVHDFGEELVHVHVANAACLADCLCAPIHPLFPLAVGVCEDLWKFEVKRHDFDVVIHRQPAVLGQCVVHVLNRRGRAKALGVELAQALPWHEHFHIILPMPQQVIP
mmetsp:Transcript_86478/g.225623  ORF Transcript_86478/g.225623 Transcript_86478/m.225623 type:complete len:261 (-) Transcript_86478:469-1251(-)